MKPYFNTIPNNVNCNPDERDRIMELLKVIPEELLTQDVIQAIQRGEPIALCSQPTTAAFRCAQHPLIQACYEGNILQYITTADIARAITSYENSKKWRKRYESRCVIDGKVCSPHKSCEDCQYKDKKRPLISSYEEHQDSQLAAEAVQRTSRGGYKLKELSDPTAETAIGRVRQESLLDSLKVAGELYAKEFILYKQGYKHKEIAILLNRSESSVTRDFKTINRLIAEFYKSWNS